MQLSFFTILTHGRKIQVYLMDFIYFPVKFSITGDVSLTKDNLAWSTSNWSDEFKVEYDVIVYSWYNYWANVLHVTTGQNHPRLPAVFFKRTYFNICSHVNGNNDYCQIYNYELKYLKTKTQVEKLFTASRSMEKPFLRLWTQTHSSSKMPNFIWVIPGILHLEPLARFQTSRSMPIWLNEYVDCPTFFPFCFFMNIQIGCFYIQLRVCT